jgi:hypothetical protein
MQRGTTAVPRDPWGRISPPYKHWAPGRIRRRRIYKISDDLMRGTNPSDENVLKRLDGLVFCYAVTFFLAKRAVNGSFIRLRLSKFVPKGRRSAYGGERSIRRGASRNRH